MNLSSPFPNFELRLKLNKEGRGQGLGKKYTFWLYEQDVPSKGCSHQCIYINWPNSSSLSDLELAVFLFFDWAPNLIDIREQFLLRQDEP